jgi:hypothetical protein
MQLFIVLLDTNLDFYWVMTKSILGKTKGYFQNKVKHKIKTKCFNKIAFLKNISLKDISLKK